jgi:hypothetical protein
MLMLGWDLRVVVIVTLRLLLWRGLRLSFRVYSVIFMVGLARVRFIVGTVVMRGCRGSVALSVSITGLKNRGYSPLI